MLDMALDRALWWGLIGAPRPIRQGGFHLKYLRLKIRKKFAFSTEFINHAGGEWDRMK